MFILHLNMNSNGEVMIYLWQIIIIIVIVLLLIISGLSRSLVHTLLHHYPEFKKKFKIPDNKDYWWDPRVSWKNKNNIKWTIDFPEIKWKRFTPVMIFKRIRFGILVQFSDAFHFFNSIEVIADHLREALYSAIVINFIYQMFFGMDFRIFLLSFLVHGTIKILISFNLGYDKIWR